MEFVLFVVSKEAVLRVFLQFLSVFSSFTYDFSYNSQFPHSSASADSAPGYSAVQRTAPLLLPSLASVYAATAI